MGTQSLNHVVFDTMKPGKQNAKDVHVNGSCVAIKQVVIEDSRDNFAGAIILPSRFTW